MVVDKTISILHFEDNKVFQSLVKDYLKSELDVSVRQERTLRNAETLLDPLCASIYDVIICDWMFPYKDASSILNLLADCGKTVIFYSCIDHDDFYKKCYSQLGYMPRSFKYIQKASANNLKNIRQLIENEL
jgi:DNA-binding NarL/FixJ family response regulator